MIVPSPSSSLASPVSSKSIINLLVILPVLASIVKESLSSSGSRPAIVPFAGASRLKVPRLSPLKNSLNVELNRDVSTVTTVALFNLEIGWVSHDVPGTPPPAAFLQESLLNRMSFDLSGISCFQ